jgi:hypothetical protein
MELTLQDLHAVLDKEVVCGFHYTTGGGSKKITYNPLDQLTRIYVDGVLYAHYHFADTAINEYNSII